MITIKEYREWINSLPTEFDECNLVYREIASFAGDKYAAKDTPIMAIGIDDENMEAYLCNDKSAKILKENE